MIGLLLAAVVAAGSGLGAWALLGASAPAPGGSKPPVASPARPQFVFTIGKVTADRTGKKGVNAAGNASVEIAGRLSFFYDTVFMNPDTWKSGIPDGAWTLFEKGLRARARKDGSAFGLGTAASTLRSLRVENSSLSVNVLVDPRGNAQTAVARVEFKAGGFNEDGSEVKVSNAASFFFQMEGGVWVVFGYPSAKTTVDATPVSPSPGPSGSAGTSNPSPGKKTP